MAEQSKVKDTYLKKARTCDGCRASEGRNECSIGYQCTDWTPLEPCPKPKTIKQLIYSGRKMYEKEK